MSWKASEGPPTEPDWAALGDWVDQFAPVQAKNKNIVIVLCNRCGKKGGTLYAGTSAVIGFKNGTYVLYGLADRGSETLLLVDTEKSL